jgi:hypothetical protein
MTPDIVLYYTEICLHQLLLEVQELKDLAGDHEEREVLLRWAGRTLF